MKRAFLIICLVCSPIFGAIVGNINGDCVVNFKDFALMAANWLRSGTGDLNSSGTVDFSDLAIFATHWLEQESGNASQTPAKATIVSPVNHATGIATTQSLSWSMSNIDCEQTAADVWFGEKGAMSKLVSATTTTTYSPSLVPSKSYQWRIDTRNSQGITTGDVWDFNSVLSQQPTASNSTETAYTYIVKSITLSATDDGYPSPPSRLKYVITALPADTNAYLQDPISGGQIRITAANLPYKLSSWGKTVWFATSTVGTTTFKWKAWDGEQYSTERTVTVNVSANPKDCISFDGSGTVTVANNTNFDLVNLRGIALFLHTRIPYGKILGKYTPGNAGYELWLIGGHPTLKLYDATGCISTVTLPARVNDGTWHNLGFAYDANGFAAIDDANDWGIANFQRSTYTDWIAVPVRTYSNSADFVIGSSYKWEIDNVRSYSFTEYTEANFYFYWGYVTQARAEAGTANVFAGITINPGATVRFKCDYDGTNNTATQIYDDLSNHLVGIFSSSSHVKYTPFFWSWYDSAAFQMQRGQ